MWYYFIYLFIYLRMIFKKRTAKQILYEYERSLAGNGKFKVDWLNAQRMMNNYHGS